MTQDPLIYLEAAKILTYTALTFLIAMWWAPSLIDLLVWLKFWKKKSRNVSTTGEELVVTKKFYQENEQARLVPRAGGLLIPVTVLGFAFIFWLFLKIEPTSRLTQFLNFITRRQTFIPIAALFFGMIFGFIDDALATLESGGNYKAGGLKLTHRLGMVSFLSIIFGLWFYFRLNITKISLFWYDLDLGKLGQPFDVNTTWLIIPFTALVLISLWGTSIIDGFDGLAAGVYIPVFLCFAALSFARGYYDIATLMMVITGAMTAYLWFNIPPAKFFLGDTGSVPISLTLGVVAILIDAVYILPIAGFILFVTEFSDVVQILSKKIFHRKVFLAAPLHHHFEALGWERQQITMRYWLVSIMSSVLGLAIGLLIK